MYALVLEETRLAPTLPRGLPNDGKRAEGVIRNLLEGGPSYCHEFGGVAAELVLRELTRDVQELIPTEKLTALQSIVRPLCDVQRNQIWSEGPTIHMNTQLLYEGHPSREGGAKVLSRIRSILEHEAAAFNDESRAVLWDMVSEAHRQANFAKGQLVDDGSPVLAELNARLVEDLKWTKRVLQLRPLSPRELRAARKIWVWHAEFEKENESSVLARELDSSYQSHPAVQLFEKLTDWDSAEDTGRLVQAKANELATAGPGAIEDFLTQAIEFFGGEDVRRILSLADALGRLATKHAIARAFFRDGFQVYPRVDGSRDPRDSGAERGLKPKQRAKLVRAS